MRAELSRRDMMRAVSAAVFTPSGARAIVGRWPLTEGPNTPKLCMLSNATPSERGMRRMKQIGVDHAILGGPRIPWEEDQLRAIIDRHRTGGLTVLNMMISGFSNAILGRPGRDQDIENVHKSIRAAGKAGLPIIEYNSYAHRATEVSSII